MDLKEAPMSILEIVIAVLLVLVLVLLWAVYRTQAQVQQALQSSQAALLQRVDQVQQNVDRDLSDSQAKMWTYLQERDAALVRNMEALQGGFAQRGEALARTTEETVRKTMESFSKIIADNTMHQAKAYQDQVQALDRHVQDKLDRITGVVDEKLQKTLEARLTSSFTLINRNLESVQQGLVSMKTLAASVGDLKKLMGNVKTRGISGEVQLGAILDNILPAGMVHRNARIKENRFVEFAVEVPSSSGTSLLLPIDSKLPGDTYLRLREAMESGDEAKTKEAMAQLRTTIRDEARDIHDKYLVPSRTTEFGILFLPFEGLYAEVVNNGLADEAQKQNVVIAGPGTLTAILHCVLMVARFAAVRQHSEKILNVLQEVRAEFGNYSDALAKVQASLQKADENLNKLITTRTNVMQRKLNRVADLEDPEGNGLPSGKSIDESE